MRYTAIVCGSRAEISSSLAVAFSAVRIAEAPEAGIVATSGELVLVPGLLGRLLHLLAGWLDFCSWREHISRRLGAYRNSVQAARSPQLVCLSKHSNHPGSCCIHHHNTCSRCKSRWCRNSSCSSNRCGLCSATKGRSSIARTFFTKLNYN